MHLELFRQAEQSWTAQGGLLQNLGSVRFHWWMFAFFSFFSQNELSQVK